MPCTTILVGKKASYDGSTMIARNDDGFFDVKKLIVVDPKKQPRKYKSVIGQLEIELPDDPLRYTATPSVSTKRGVWAANGINEANVGMTATETITTTSSVHSLILHLSSQQLQLPLFSRKQTKLSSTATLNTAPPTQHRSVHLSAEKS